VILNIIINAVEAMSGASNRPRESLIRTAKHPSSNGALVTIQDSGPGLTSESFERLFD
jgi:C4-dicarboxylate-specific signal transduction histidine kinase